MAQEKRVTLPKLTADGPKTKVKAGKVNSYATVTDMKSMMRIKEKNRRALTKDSERLIVLNENQIKQLREDVSILRRKYHEIQFSNKAMIKSVPYKDKGLRYAMANKSPEESLKFMEEAVGTMRNKLGELIHIKQKKIEEKIALVEEVARRKRVTDESWDVDYVDKTSKLENKIKKLERSVFEARAIKLRFQSLLDELIADCNSIPARLDKLDKMVSTQMQEYVEMAELCKGAECAAAHAQKELRIYGKRVRSIKERGDYLVNLYQGKVEDIVTDNEMNKEKRMEYQFQSDSDMQEVTERQKEEALHDICISIDLMKDATEVTHAEDIPVRVRRAQNMNVNLIRVLETMGTRKQELQARLLELQKKSHKMKDELWRIRSEPTEDELQTRRLSKKKSIIPDMYAPTLKKRKIISNENVVNEIRLAALALKRHLIYHGVRTEANREVAMAQAQKTRPLGELPKRMYQEKPKKKVVEINRMLNEKQDVDVLLSDIEQLVKPYLEVERIWKSTQADFTPAFLSKGQMDSLNANIKAEPSLHVIPKPKTPVNNVYPNEESVDNSTYVTRQQLKDRERYILRQMTAGMRGRRSGRRLKK